MGRQDDLFITVVEAARILGRTPEEVISLCNEGLIARRSTGTEITVRQSDVNEVLETNLNDMARPRDLVRMVLTLQREVRALQSAVDLMGKVNGMLSSSLSEVPTPDLVGLMETARTSAQKESWEAQELLAFSEVFLRMADSDILRLNDMLGVHDAWRTFYVLCLKMCWYVRDAGLEPNRDLETAQVLLQRGLRNLRSIGVMFVENAEFLKTSRELLERTLSHDLAEFDTLIKQLKSAEPSGSEDVFVQNH